MKYVLLSDIHANDLALQAITQYAQGILGNRSKIRYLFLGDLVGYGSLSGSLNCIRWLRSHPDVLWIPGNHDEWIVTQNDPAYHGSAILTLLAQRAYLLQPDHKDDFLWFEAQVKLAITERSMFSLEEGRLALNFTHATIKKGFERVNYLYPFQAGHTLLRWDMMELRQKYQEKLFCLFYGHTHYPVFGCLQGDDLVYKSIHYGKAVDIGDGGAIAINPGSVGQPRDSDSRSSFVILDTKARTVTFHRVEYDLDAMAMQLEANGNFESRFHLLSWDDRDAITDELKRKGKSINPQKTYKELITRIRAEHKDSNLSLYQGVYRKVEWGLEVIK